jgi:hypothetical protein
MCCPSNERHDNYLVLHLIQKICGRTRNCDTKGFMNGVNASNNFSDLASDRELLNFTGGRLRTLYGLGNV